MKTPLLVATCILALVMPSRAFAEEATILLPSDQIETLVAPIALYPDPLVALILPASTHPSDVVLAARYLAGGGSPETVLDQPWDETVKALTRYREVVDYLDRNLEWTRRLGDCFAAQPDDVMDAIQSLRARARGQGLLADNAQQQVILESDEICIVPTNPTVIYIPRYDPVVLCGPIVTTYFASSWLSFGVAYSVGPWLSYDCDWRSHYVRVNRRPASWYYQPDWHRRRESVAWTRWTPPPRHERHWERDGDAPRGNDRRWIGAGQTVWNNPPASPRHAPSGPSRERDSRWNNTRPRRETGNEIATAPSVVATAPDVPTAPVVSSQPPGRSNQPPPERTREPRRFPRNDGDSPRSDRGPRSNSRPLGVTGPMTNPPPMTSSPVGPPVQPPAPMTRSYEPANPPARTERSDRTDRSDRGDRNDRGGRWDRNNDRQQPR
ncbi:MAG: DUF3300 domain-containing protein [Candidatus Didemnitutus sp.]|nr:DUF3300 domain-containing protein [Candidatus Didemnitutus sp.]